MAILKKATNTQAFLKAGFLGFPGSGKTFTASHFAMQIASRLGTKKPVAFFDTESGSDFLIPKFDAAGIELLTVKSQAFKDLLDAGKEAEQSCSVLIVDSVTHVWRELCDTYRKRRNIQKLQFQHWADIKGQWQEWTKFYLNSKLHIMVLGRSGFEYDFDVDEDGKKELIKTGTKMKVESEFGFEPSLLIEMERVRKDSEVGSGWIHRAHVLKDRTDTINGKAFDFTSDNKGKEATFKAFEPVLNALNIGGEHIGFIESDSSELISENRGTEYAQKVKRAEVALDEIKHSLSVLYPGTSDASKQAKATICEELLGVRVWSAVETKPLIELEFAVKVLRHLETLFIDVKPEIKDLKLAVQTAKEDVTATIEMSKQAEG